MKAMLAVVVLLVAAPQARAGDEELADRLKKVEARLATLEAGLQAEEARKKVEAPQCVRDGVKQVDTDDGMVLQALLADAVRPVGGRPVAR